jgi:hypothetical protein
MSATKFAASLEIPLVRTGRGPTEIRVPIARVHGTPSPPVFLADQHGSITSVLTLPADCKRAREEAY